MDTSDAILILLQKQDEYRKQAFQRPRGTEAFHYGEAVGIDKGFQMAIDALTTQVEQEAAAEKAAESED